MSFETSIHPHTEHGCHLLPERSGPELTLFTSGLLSGLCPDGHFACCLRLIFSSISQIGEWFLLYLPLRLFWNRNQPWAMLMMNTSYEVYWDEWYHPVPLIRATHQSHSEITCHHLRMAIIKKTTDNKCCRAERPWGPLPWEPAWSFLHAWSTDPGYNPAISTGAQVILPSGHGDSQVYSSTIHNW